MNNTATPAPAPAPETLEQRVNKKLSAATTQNELFGIFFELQLEIIGWLEMIHLAIKEQAHETETVYADPPALTCPSCAAPLYGTHDGRYEYHVIPGSDKECEESNKPVRLS